MEQTGNWRAEWNCWRKKGKRAAWFKISLVSFDTSSSHVYTHTHKHTLTHTHTHIYIYTENTQVCKYIHTHTHIYKYACIYIYIHTYLKICMYICVCFIYMSLHISFWWSHTMVYTCYPWSCCLEIIELPKHEFHTFISWTI